MCDSVSSPEPVPPNGDQTREAPSDPKETLRENGLGIIFAGSVVGSGELIATTIAGAEVGFWLLWIILLSCMVKVGVHFGQKLGAWRALQLLKAFKSSIAQRSFDSGASTSRSHLMALASCKRTRFRLRGLWVALGLLLASSVVAAEGVRSATDRFGWPDVRGRSTGWFHLESIRGRDLIVTPGGQGFLPLGVNHISAIRSTGKGEHDLFNSRYDKDALTFRRELLSQFDAWGFNATGGSVPELNAVLPYFAAITLTRTSKYFGQPGERNPYEFPDVFDPLFERELRAKLRDFCGTHRENPNLIAYYWTDTPTWDIAKTRKFRGTDWVSEIRRLDPKSPGRQHYHLYLENRYDGDLVRFKRAYDVKLEAWSALGGLDINSLDLSRYEIRRDDEDFLGKIARRLYAIAGKAMREFDPHHMVFGEKYLLGDIPEQVLHAAVPYIDAVAVQPGDGYLPIYPPSDIYPASEISELHQLTGLPVMICDHQISFSTPRYPRSIWPYHQRESEAEAATATRQFLRTAFDQPYVIGYMRCQYITRFSARRDASKLGLLRDDGTAYADLLEAHRSGYREVRDRVREALGGATE